VPKAGDVLFLAYHWGMLVRAKWVLRSLLLNKSSQGGECKVDEEVGFRIYDIFLRKSLFATVLIELACDLCQDLLSKYVRA
jgi:hypothetical protein